MYIFRFYFLDPFFSVSTSFLSFKFYPFVLMTTKQIRPNPKAVKLLFQMFSISSLGASLFLAVCGDSSGGDVLVYIFRFFATEIIKTKFF